MSAIYFAQKAAVASQIMSKMWGIGKWNCFLNREVRAQNALLDVYAYRSISILRVSLRVWAQMPHVPGKRRSSAQNVACRASMAAINSRKKDKENLNPSNSDDLDSLSFPLFYYCQQTNCREKEAP